MRYRTTQPRPPGQPLPVWARPWPLIAVLAVALVTTILWPQYSPFSAPYQREKAGYSGLVIETGTEQDDTDSPQYKYAIVEEAPGRRVKHYLPPYATGVLEGFHVIKEPGYGGRVHCPEYEDLMKQYRQYEAKQKQ